MRLLANENFPRASVQFLIDEGHDVEAIGISFFGISDEEVILHANQTRRLIITFDKDYGELIFNKGLIPEDGVLLCRMKAYEPSEPGRLINELLKKDIELKRCLTIFHGQMLRQKKY
jgi:predicted nuclease of predicted toxin-antitoxin system